MTTHARPADRRRLVAGRRHRDARRARPRARTRSGEAQERAQDRAALWRAFRKAGVVAARRAAARDDPHAAVDAAIGFTARSPAPLALIPIEDMLGLAEQPNLPGTIDEHPNWRRRLSSPPREVLDTPAAQRRLAILRERRSMTPRATMRLQFHKGFTFADAERLVPYFARARHQPCLCLADHHGAAGLDARLRRDRSDPGQSGARRRGRHCAAWSRRCATPDSA